MMKSRDNLVVEGDRNTSYFHKAVLVRREKNRILSLKYVVGEDIWDPIFLREHIRSYFVNLFSSSSNSEHDLWNNTPV